VAQHNSYELVCDGKPEKPVTYISSVHSRLFANVEPVNTR